MFESQFKHVVDVTVCDCAAVLRSALVLMRSWFLFFSLTAASWKCSLERKMSMTKQCVNTNGYLLDCRSFSLFQQQQEKSIKMMKSLLSVTSCLSNNSALKGIKFVWIHCFTFQQLNSHFAQNKHKNSILTWFFIDKQSKYSMKSKTWVSCHFHSDSSLHQQLHQLSLNQ